MNEIPTVIFSFIGAFVIAYLTAYLNRRKTDAEITQIYARLGLDKEKIQAESANTWMEVARKATEEYEYVMNDNINLKKEVFKLNKKILALYKRIEALQKRIQALKKKIAELNEEIAAMQKRINFLEIKKKRVNKGSKK